MKTFLIALLLPGFAYAELGNISWTTFESNLGYELQYPNCWEIRHDFPEQEGDFKDGAHLFFTEGEKCKTPRRGKYAENGITTWFLKLSSTDLEKEKKDLQEDSVYRLKIKRWILFKKLSLKDNETYTYVEHFPSDKFIRWNLRIFCKTGILKVVGPNISNPSSELLTKIKNGDLSLPEPEKRILESIKCTEPKK